MVILSAMSRCCHITIWHTINLFVLLPAKKYRNNISNVQKINVSLSQRTDCMGLQRT